METVITDAPEEAAVYLRAGKLVAFPTETVYGLGADAFDPEAVDRIFEAKGRPASNPLIVHIAEPGDVARLATSVPPSAHALMARFFPGPLTVVLPKQPGVPEAVTAGLSTVGIRMPAHAVAQRFLAAAGRPVAAPSANLSGRPSPTTWQAVLSDLDGRIACLLRGPRSDAGLESTVVDCTSETPVLLRPGAVTFEALREVVPTIQIAGTGEELLARSPGTRFRHYQPRARVHLIDHVPTSVPERAAYIGLDPSALDVRFALVRVCSSVEEYAWALFDFFRQSDSASIEHIFCEAVPPVGLGRALMDRLQRAAA